MDGTRALPRSIAPPLLAALLLLAFVPVLRSSAPEADAGLAAQEIFHSTQSANLPTAEMLRAGNWLFEISHRFFTPVSEGTDALWGVDGPAIIRLGLSIQATDRLLLGIHRSNWNDNLQFDARVGVLDASQGSGRVELAVAGGIAWNTQVNEIDDVPGGRLRQDNESQQYAQLIANVLIGETFAVGVVPAVVRNRNLLEVESETGLALGIYGQAYVSEGLSFLGEWIFSEASIGQENDSGTFGLEIETRGHFFKVLVSNQPLLNQAQILGGGGSSFEADQLRFGFNITRLLPF